MFAVPMPDKVIVYLLNDAFENGKAMLLDDTGGVRVATNVWTHGWGSVLEGAADWDL